MNKPNSQRIMDQLASEFRNLDLSVVKTGESIKLIITNVEDGKEKTQTFEGKVVSKSNGVLKTSIKVRKMVQGIGVEKTFVSNAPNVRLVKLL